MRANIVFFTEYEKDAFQKVLVEPLKGVIVVARNPGVLQCGENTTCVSQQVDRNIVTQITPAQAFLDRIIKLVRPHTIRLAQGVVEVTLASFGQVLNGEEVLKLAHKPTVADTSRGSGDGMLL